MPNKSNFLPISIWPKSAKLKCGIVCIRVFIERDKIFLLILVSIYLLLLLLLLGVYMTIVLHKIICYYMNKLYFFI